MVLLLFVVALANSISVTSWFGNHMVLQTVSDNGPPAVIAGTDAIAMENVTVRVVGNSPIPGSPFVGVADLHGNWNVPIPCEAGGGPYIVNVSAGTLSVVAHDVYFGDVFVCSGQENMALPVSAAANGTNIIADAANNANIRLFRAPTNKSFPSQDETNIVEDWGGSLEWEVTSAASVANFSAVCYLAAVAIKEAQTKDRALGLVLSAVPSSPVEAWMPPYALEQCSIAPKNWPVPVQDGNVTNKKWLRPCVLFNQMVGPLLGMSIRSILFYQGEANMNNGFHLSRHNYFCLFNSLIRSWRGHFNSNSVPFVFVQLHSWGTGNTGEVFADFSNFGDIRLAQSTVLLSNDAVGMAVSYDRGSHAMLSPYKSDVGYRLGMKTVQIAYNMPTAHSDGPQVLGACVETPPGLDPQGKTNSTKISLLLSNSGGLELRLTSECEKQSPICCNASEHALVPGVAPGVVQVALGNVNEGQTWYDATLEVENTNLNVYADLGPSLKKDWTVWQVRYAVGAFPSCAVYNTNAIPLAPFGPLAVSPTCQPLPSQAPV